VGAFESRILGMSGPSAPEANAISNRKNLASQNWQG
jgi:hypothetical protein